MSPRCACPSHIGEQVAAPVECGRLASSSSTRPRMAEPCASSSVINAQEAPCVPGCRFLGGQRHEPEDIRGAKLNRPASSPFTQQSRRWAAHSARIRAYLMMHRTKSSDAQRNSASAARFTRFCRTMKNSPRIKSQITRIRQVVKASPLANFLKNISSQLPRTQFEHIEGAERLII